MPESSTGPIELTVARIEGKLDVLAEKLDANREILVQRIEAGDREAAQGLRLIEHDVNQLGQTIRALDERDGKAIEALQKKAEQADRFNARLVGIVIGVTIFAGASGVGIAKALGI